MRLYTPWILFLFLLIPFIIWYIKNKKNSSILYSNLKLIKEVKPNFWIIYRNIPIILRLLVISLIIIALSRPQTDHITKFSTKGIDIMLILDISGSMRAEDFEPENRLQAAKKVIRDFLKARQNDRVGLVIFAGKSYTLCPLTLDYEILLQLLDNIEIGQIEEDTAIGMAIATAINRLSDSESKSKAAILLTDGENNKGEVDPITAAQVAAELGIRIYTIGIGKEGGAPIPKYDTIFGKDYIKNPDGSLYLTVVDEETLKQIADLTDAIYFRATDRDKLSDVYEEISKLEKAKIGIKKYTKYKELSAYFLFPALLLLVIEIILSNTKLRKIP